MFKRRHRSAVTRQDSPHDSSGESWSRAVAREVLSAVAMFVGLVVVGRLLGYSSNVFLVYAAVVSTAIGAHDLRQLRRRHSTRL